MNTIWIYSKDEPNLRERLMGMEFDRAILSAQAQRDIGIRAHVFSLTRATGNSGTPAEQSASPTNSDLIQLLSDARDYVNRIAVRSYQGDEVLERLNAVLAQQH